jgi:ketosteroid isomerase-like protein
MLFFACIYGVAVAADPVASPERVMAHHITAVKKDDVEGVMQDYAADAVIVTQTTTFIGAANIRKFFEHLAAEHRDWKTYEVTQEAKSDGVVLQKALKTGKVEVYVVRHGKILFQTVPG